jgi:Ca2+-binding RTX toxin-like protein
MSGAVAVLTCFVVLVGLPSAAGAGGMKTCRGERPTIVGTSGPDEIVGTPGPDVITGGDGPDIIQGLGGADIICGGEGGDRIAPGEGQDYVNGDGPTQRSTFLVKGDLVSYAEAGAVMVDLRTQTSTGQGRDSLVSIERIEGSPYDDFLKGSEKGQIFYGGKGNDVIRSVPGLTDRAFGGPGNDWIRSWTVSGGPGNDLIRAIVVSYADAAAGVTVDLSEGTATGDGSDRLLEVVRLIGSNFDDILSGGEGDDEIYGRGGDDALDGGEHATEPGDLLDGGGGTDSCVNGERVSNCES